MKKRPDQLYTPIDLFHTYVTVFVRKGIIGGLKGMQYPPSWSDWVVRARFLLTTVTDNHIAQLFETGDDDSKYHYAIRYNKFGASWIAALLRKKKWRSTITAHMLQDGDVFFYSCFHTSLLLYETPDVAIDFIRYLDTNNEARQCNPVAVYCLQLLDGKYGTGHAQQYAHITIDRKSKKLVDDMLFYSTVLRASINTTDTDTFQQLLTAFITTSITPEQFTRHLTAPVDIRAFPFTGQPDIAAYQSKVKRRISANNRYSKYWNTASQHLLLPQKRNRISLYHPLLAHIIATVLQKRKLYYYRKK